MKLLKIILFLFAGIFVFLILVVFIFLKSFDVNKYLPQITKQLGQVINRQVGIDHANLDLSFQGLSLKLNKVIVKDDPSFSQKEFLSIDQVYIGLEIMPLLIDRQVHINRVLISSPHISIVQSVEGKINAQTMTPEVSKASSHSEASAVTSLNSASSSTMPLPVITIQSVVIEHGQVSFEDKNPQMPLSILIKNIEGKINGFSSLKPFNFNLSLNILGNEQNNMNISGRCLLDLSKSSVNISNLRVDSDLSAWDWVAVKKISPNIEKTPVWPQEIKGNLLIQAPSQFIASSTGLDQFSLDILLSKGYIKLKELAAPIETIGLEIQTDLKDLSLKSFEAHIGSGLISADGKIHDFTISPNYTFKLQTKELKIQDLIDQSSYPATLKGSLNSEISLNGASFEPETMLKNLKGEGSLNLLNGTIEKLNILKMLLDKLSFIPGIENKITSSLSDKVKSKLDTDTTVLDKADAKFKIQDKIVTIDDAQIGSNLFSMNTQGTVGFDLTADLNVKSYLAADISNDIVKSAKPLKGLLDDQQQIYIPGKVFGQGAAIKYVPQIDDLAKKAMISEGTDQLEKVLDKNPGVKNILNSVLGGSTGGQSSDSTNSDNPDQTQKDSSKKLVNDLFNKFLK